MTRAGGAVLAALTAAAIAGVMYWRTLLPGVDFGDTGSFQTIATLPLLVPRHAYPLYFALARGSLIFDSGEPAFILNALSAVLGAAAIGAFAWLVWEITRNAAAALWGALLLAASYTFWSQAIIAEVYTLQVLLIAAVFVCAVRWWRAPSLSRLAVLYAVYALSFGNHLSMIFLAPALLWLLREHALRPAALALAAALAAAGALQYAWNFEGLWLLTSGARPLDQLLATFWFDVTKSDWRETLVGTVPPEQLGNRAAMYWWDLRQQFGAAGIVVACAGAAALTRASRRLAAAFGLAFLVTFAFAFFYNVGDTHVFLLPSHAVVAVFASVGAAWLFQAGRSLRAPYRTAAMALMFAIPIWRIADTWPAVDRSGDRRPTEYAAAATAGLAPGNALFVWDFNWQVYNGINAYVTSHRPELPRASSGAVLWRFPQIVRQSHDLGRDVVLTTNAAQRVRATYGDRFTIRPDPRAAVPSVAELLDVPGGTPYVLVWMTPLSIAPVSRDDLSRAVTRLAGRDLPAGRYAALAGFAGHAPLVARGSDRPFRVSTRLGDLDLDIRIEAWLPFDTMRRAGFGHVVADRRHAFTVERGLSFVAFGPTGRVLRTGYAGGLFAPQPRLLIPVLR